MHLKALLATALVTLSGTVIAAPTVDPISECVRSTELLGNGNPHQNALRKQVSEPMDCDSQSAGCSVSRLTSYTIGYSVDASLAQWISGGFSVSKSWTTGNTYTCNGKPGETICVWVNVAHTAYTVQNFNAGTRNSCPEDASGSYVLQSPNTNNAGGNYYCRHGFDCGTIGQQYWALSGA